MIAIKRPLVCAFAAMTAGVLARLCKAPPEPVALLSLLALCIFTFAAWVLHRIKSKIFIQFIFFLFLFFAGFFTTYFHDNYDNRIAVQGEHVLKGTVDKVSRSEYSVRIFLRSCSVDGHRLINGAIIETKPDEWAVLSKGSMRGGTLQIRGELGSAGTPENPGQFDLCAYYKSQGYVYYVENPKFISFEGCPNPVINFLEAVKARLGKIYQICCDSVDAGVFEAMVLGDKSDMEESVYDLFSSGGIGHILAISGLHISILGMGLYRFLRKAGAGYSVSAAVSGIFVLMYGIMTSNSVSAVRAVIMFICAVYAQVIGRTYDILSAVSLAAIIILSGNPYIITNAGFLLSFLAIAGVAVVSKGFGMQCLKGFTGSVAIQLATLPVILWFYYETPVYSVFLNMLVIPLMTLTMSSALFTAAAGCISTAAGIFCAGVGHYILLLFRFCCRFILALPGSVYVAGRPKMWQVIIYYILVLFFSCHRQFTSMIHYAYDKRKMKRPIKYPRGRGRTANIPVLERVRSVVRELARVRSIAWGLERVRELVWVLVLVPALWVLLVRPHNELEITFLNVGQGDGIYISLPGGGNVFIDGGSSSKEQVYSKVIEPFLKYKGVQKLDFLFLTHGDEDHYAGWSEAVSGNIYAGKGGTTEGDDLPPYIPEIDNLILNEADYEEYIAGLETYASDILTDSAGTETMQGEGLDITGLAAAMASKGTQVGRAGLGTVYIFNNSRLISLNDSAKVYDGDSSNDNSIVLLLEYNDKSFLFTGDISSKREKELSERVKQYGIGSLTVLKAAHHGSKYSTDEAFLDALRPEYCVISCGANNVYGHPHKEVLERLREAGAEVFRTDESGAIILKVSEEKVNISEMLAP